MQKVTITKITIIGANLVMISEGASGSQAETSP